MKGWNSSGSTPWGAYCGKIKRIVIEDGVTSIGDWAFSNCSKLTSVAIPDGITSIGKCAFDRCSKLSSVTLPDGLISIGQYAFSETELLLSITIPRSVTSLGYRAFGPTFTDYQPTDITVGWTENIPEWNNFTKDTHQSGITLHVPCGTEELYQAADGWKDYTIEGEGGPYTITVESDDPNMGTVDAIKIDN